LSRWETSRFSSRTALKWPICFVINDVCSLSTRSLRFYFSGCCKALSGFPYSLQFLSRSDHVLVTKHLSQNDVMVKVLDPGSDTDCTSTLRTEYSHIAVVVDLQCEGSALFLSHVSRNIVPSPERRHKSNSFAVSLSMYTHTHTHKPSACLVIMRVNLVHPITGHEGPEEE
jgi:hypothetical protein